MLSHLKDIGLYILSLIGGYIGIILAYHLAIAAGLFTMNDEIYDSGALWYGYMMGTTYAWMAGAALGLGFFIWRKDGRYWILLLPALLPACYGLSVLVKLGALSAS